MSLPISRKYTRFTARIVAAASAPAAAAMRRHGKSRGRCHEAKAYNAAKVGASSKAENFVTIAAAKAATAIARRSRSPASR
jgi:hypothetical protein